MTLRDRMLIDLGISTEYMDDAGKQALYDEIEFYLSAASEFISREGVTLNLNSIGDQMLVLKYAAFLYRGGDNTKLPPMIRKPLNDRIFQEDITGYNPDAVTDADTETDSEVILDD